jgi:hypothetical protein
MESEGYTTNVPPATYRPTRGVVCPFVSLYCLCLFLFLNFKLNCKFNRTEYFFLILLNPSFYFIGSCLSYRKSDNSNYILTSLSWFYLERNPACWTKWRLIGINYLRADCVLFFFVLLFMVPGRKNSPFLWNNGIRRNLHGLLSLRRSHRDDPIKKTY